MAFFRRSRVSAPRKKNTGEKSTGEKIGQRTIRPDERRKAKRASYRKGLAVERQAAQMLSKKGYRILEQRLRTAEGEIDLLAWDRDTTVLVEVKYRAEGGDAAYAVLKSQQKRLVRAALWLQSHRPQLCLDNIRFDAVLVSENAPAVHIENAWQADDAYGQR